MAGFPFPVCFPEASVWEKPIPVIGELRPYGGRPHARDVGGFPHLAYGTPRKLPKPDSLPGRVVVLDVAFAANAGGASYEKTTLPFIQGLGSRLAMWVDHHDHDRHLDYADDSRFVLRTKAQHGACPEMVTPERVAAAGPVDTICCHLDFDACARLPSDSRRDRALRGSRRRRAGHRHEAGRADRARAGSRPGAPCQATR